MKIFLIFLFLCLSLQAFNQVDLENGLVAYYPFCGNTDDLSGNVNNGAIFGLEVYAEDKLGNPDGALLFNGIDNYVQVPNSPSLENLTEELTISVCFKTFEYDVTNYNGFINSWAVLLNKSTEVQLGTSQFSVLYDAPGTIYFATGVLATQQILELNKWYNITVVYSDSMAYFFLDGVLINSIDIEIIPNNMAIDIGRDVPGVTEFFNGVIDEIRIYNRALNNEEISAIISSENDECKSTSIIEWKEKEKDLIVYPNPADKSFYINNESGLQWIRVYNVTGELLTQIERPQNKIDISSFNSGVYILVMEFDNRRVIERIIKK